MRVRFDDSLKTVLAADTSTAFGARAAYRQLVDLIARGRASLDDTLRERLAALRPTMPAEQRAALARGLALADPPVTLIAFLADDTPEVAAAVLRAARLSPEDWDWLLPRLGPHGRSVLRRRGDLPPTAVRALESFGSTDFALSHEAPESVATHRLRRSPPRKPRPMPSARWATSPPRCPRSPPRATMARTSGSRSPSWSIASPPISASAPPGRSPLTPP